MAAYHSRDFKHTGNDRGSQNRENQSGDDKFKMSVDSAIISAFRGYQKELDQKHDKHERLVKLSRDVTIESKRVIFLLHRINSEATREAILQEACCKTNEINKKLKAIAIELEAEDPYRFLRAYTNGLQEYIEAISFYEYLLNKDLLTLRNAEQKLTFHVATNSKDDTENGEEMTTENLMSEEERTSIKRKKVQFYLPPTEYVLGLADLTGELMRCCINSIGHGDIDKPFELVAFMRDVYEGFSLCSGSAPRELRQKMNTMRQSLLKVENTCYTLQVRGSEIPKHMLLDAITTQTEMISH